MTTRTCQGHNANGSPCTFKARFSSHYCARHASQAPKPAPTNRLFLVEVENVTMIKYLPETGGQFSGTVEEINALLVATGYAEIAVRRNMMSDMRYIEAKDTPIYCSPASETYWSM